MPDEPTNTHRARLSWALATVGEARAKLSTRTKTHRTDSDPRITPEARAGIGAYYLSTLGKDPR